jgi:hypothetical protein
MSIPKLSLVGCKDEPCFFDDGGRCLYTARRLAGFFDRPDIADKMKGSYDRFINLEDKYDIIPVPVIRELDDALAEVEESATAYLDAEYNVLPGIAARISAEDEDLFEISQNNKGDNVYNLYASLASVSALKQYFDQALQLNKDIEYGRYS